MEAIDNRKLNSEDDMKNNLHIDFFKSIVHSQQIQSDNFFSNDTVDMARSVLQNDYDVFYRQISQEERRIITKDAFDLMLFWVRNDEITVDFFERFMTILVSFTDQIDYPLEEDVLPAMIEMMSLVDFKDHVIYATIEVYIDSPNLLRRQLNMVH